jgi:lambda repressor-like predicted transcriptional regulator
MSKKTRSNRKSAQTTDALAAKLTAAAKKSGPSPVAGLRTFLSQKKNVVLVVIVLVILALLYLFKSVFIVAVVNGQPIYRWTVITQLEKQGGQQVLDSLVVEALVKQAIRNAKVEVGQDKIDARVKEIEDQLTQQGMTLEQALEQEGLTRQQLVDDIRLQYGAEQLVANTITVSDEEIDTYITDNQEFLPTDMTEEELRTTVREQLYSSKASEAIQQWVEGLRADAKILYLKQYSTTVN